MKVRVTNITDPARGAILDGTLSGGVTVQEFITLVKQGYAIWEEVPEKAKAAKPAEAHADNG